MNNEVLEALKETKIAFENDATISKFICVHVMQVYEQPIMNNTLEYIQSNRPTETLFPEICNHKSFIMDESYSNFWVHFSNDGSTKTDWMKNVVIPQKIKYLKLLITKLQSELTDIPI